MRIGLLTGGGDCPGLNAVIRAVVLSASREDASVLGFRDGWRGILDDDAVELVPDSVTGLVQRGGTILGSSRVNPDHLRANLPRIKQVLADRGVDVLVPVGGEGTLTAAHWLSENGIAVVGVPKTIDNDIDGTDVTFGFDTAVAVATDAVDRLRTTAESHRRVLLIEVMGRHAGWIALHAAIAGGAHMVLIPEQKFDPDQVAASLRRRFDAGQVFAVVVVAEGAQPEPGTMDFSLGEVDEFGHRRFTGIAQQLQVALEDRLDLEVRTTVLGYVQRGGTPTPYDRVLATRLGSHAVTAAMRGEFGVMAALSGTDMVTVPLETAVARRKTVPPERYAEALRLHRW